MAVNYQKIIATNIIETDEKQFVLTSEKNAIANLGTASTKNAGNSAGDVPILNDQGKLSETILPDLTIDMVGLAPIASPTFTGTPAIKDKGNILTETSNINGGYF